MQHPPLPALALLALVTLPLAAAPQEEEAAEEQGLTLERIFPEKSFFGPSARGAAFSHDGRYAAWRYRPWLERRHGNDLWLHDFESWETTRLTSADVMARFQAAAREVRDDRAAKAEARKEEAGEESPDERIEVGEDDAEDEDAPRWGGVASFEWSPVAAELLFSSGGDLYRWRASDGGIERLTATRERERSAQWLPGGSGYTYRSGDAVLRVVDGRSVVEQIDPELDPGFELFHHELSPDGQKLALVARKGDRSSGGGRTVNIASYRDRFMDVREVPRQTSDDPMPTMETAVYLYRIPAGLDEDGELVRLHRFEHAGPRDVIQEPDWAPDSSKVAFAVYEQASGHVVLYEGSFPLEGDGDEEEVEDEAEEEIADHPARPMHRFLHAGGPVTPRMIEPHYLADSRHLVLMTELSGFRHVHRFDPVYESLEQLTRGRGEFYPLDPTADRGRVYASSTLVDPACLDLFAIDPESGEATRLTTRRGRYVNPVPGPDGRRVLANYVRYGQLSELVHLDVETGEQVALTDSHPDEARELTAASPELFTYENRHGHTIHAHLWRPDDWAPEDRRPLLIYVYGGPLGTSKQVREGSFDSAGYFFGQYMAKVHGYVTCTIDPRGMSGYGALFEKANFERVGLPQVEDLTDGVTHLVEHYGVDPERVGIHGWSFGGFQTQMCLYTEPDVFQVGIAGAGPTEWENYNAWYSTGTIGSSRVGSTDLAEYSLLPRAEGLEGQLLLVHGMEDSNVLYQDTVRVYMALLDAGKETHVELFLDPTGGHGLGGHVSRLARYRKYEDFLLRHLGEG